MIRKLLAGLLCSLVLVIGMTGTTSAQDTSNFIINSFEADYYLSRSQDQQPSLRVVEQITATFPDYDQNHGIERAIPKDYKNNSLDLKIESVTDNNGKNWNYSDRTSNGNLVLRIGDANRYVQGEQTYVITYTMRNVISFFDDHQELYWDVNGDQWDQKFNNVVARLHVDRSIPSTNIGQSKCFTGTYQSTNQDCTIDQDQSENSPVITYVTNRPLNPNETLTFVTGFSAGTFAKPPTNWRAIILMVAWLLIFFGAPLIALIIMIRRWLQSGRDPKGKGVIVPQYQPPKDMNPVLAELILSERSTPKAISATILDLCIKGYLKIYETEKKKFIGKDRIYELELIKAPGDLSREEQKVVAVLFGSNPSIGTRADLNSLANKLHSKAKELKVLADKRVTELGYFTTNPETARTKYVSIGSVLLVLGFALVFVPFLRFSSIGLSIAGVITLIISAFMASRTQKGVETKDYLLGMRDYMKLTEADRIKTLQSPSGAEKITIDPKDPKQLIKLYERLLPFAVLFGIEKEWAQQFASLYTEPPQWYHSNSAFSAVLITNAITNTNAAAVKSFTSPSSSGSSGLGGGGFSGGGGGGGGGGGW